MGPDIAQLRVRICVYYCWKHHVVYCQPDTRCNSTSDYQELGRDASSLFISQDAEDG